MTLRIIAAPVALVCFLIVISRLDVLDTLNYRVKKTGTTEWSQTVKRKISPVAAPGKKRADQTVATAQNDPATVSSFSMHENWSIDPFEPLFKETPKDPSQKATYVDSDTGGDTPLEKIDLSQLKLTGIVRGASGSKGLVREASGRGHIIVQGTRIGTHGGLVAEVLSDKIIIKEKMRLTQMMPPLSRTFASCPFGEDHHVLLMSFKFSSISSRCCLL